MIKRQTKKHKSNKTHNKLNVLKCYSKTCKHKKYTSVYGSHSLGNSRSLRALFL
jgi:hypothetical protein